MRKLFGFIFVATAAMLLLQSCGAIEDAIDDATTRTEDVDVELPSIDVTGTPAVGRVAFAVLQACGGGATSLNGLLATVSGWEDLESHLEGISIQRVAYQITGNTTPVDLDLSLQVTDPDTGLLESVGSTTIVAETDVNVWTLLPFAEGGAAIVQHYLSNRDAEFEYCAEADPDDPDLSLTVWFQLNVEVTVGL